MWFLYILSWIGLAVQVLFMTLCIAAGLYYMAEIVEEYTVMAARTIRYMIYFISAVYICLLLFENLPFSLIVVGLILNVLYIFLLKAFPFVEFTSPLFIIAVVLVVYDHYLAFNYFATVWHPFNEVLSFFTLCVWLLPFSFFVSLSANENTLPTLDVQQDKYDDFASSYLKNKPKKYGLLAFLKTAQESLLPQRIKKGF